MVSYNAYVKDILSNILNSYEILSNLQDSSKDLQTITRELSKIRGFLIVLSKKIETREENSSDFIKLRKLSLYYLDNYDFFREIEQVKSLYSDDPSRVKNLRMTIISSFNDKKFIEFFTDVRNDIEN